MTTVSYNVMAPIMIRLSTEPHTVQAMIRLLKKDLAPIDSNTHNQLQIDYQNHLAKALTGQQTPDKWFQVWRLVY
ncbi:hypothetical protein EJ02DRAFT_481631 [Clathrospora elynae]|uniref:Uncharacterized protein n=1 Tax=Clathrospora elynae TaxID=706981 RepID=A0A6A5SFP1_9PLEO|nr:hypothetical protein EJ02DRAFT_481631 [Clathrospora elynae]